MSGGVTRKQFLHGLLAGAMAPVLGGCGARDAGAQRLKLAHGLDTNHPVHKAMVYMGQVLAQQSGGAMQLEIHPAGQLGAERDLIELLQVGSIALTKVSASPLESFAPAMKVFSVPYVFRDAGHFWRFLGSGPGRQLLLSLQQVRLRGLAYYDAGSRSFYTTHRAVHSPADLAGLKIRVQKSKTSVQMVQALGAAATPIAWAELYTALQQGIVDGAENNPPSFYLSRHFEVARYFSLDEHTFVPDVLMVSTHVWDRLTAEQQAWLQAAADASAQHERELWRAATQEAMAAVTAAGVEVIHPDKAAFRAAVEPMYAGYRGTPLGDLLATIRGMP